MSARESGSSQETAAAKGGFSARTGRRIEKKAHQPKRDRPHNWRTRVDPLLLVWEQELIPMLEKQPKLQAMTLFEYLQQKYPGKYGNSILRTLQRRVKQWRATHGSPKEVMFQQEHLPGVMGLSDFTELKSFEVTIQGKPLRHILYHYRLAYSGWQYVQIIQGGESFIALSQGLQNALHQSGGSPLEHRTDSLSAAYRNLGNHTNEDLTQMYQNLCQHYGIRPTRNNLGKSHENGSIESPHGHFKNRLHQAVLLRNSNDFTSIADYQQLIDSVIKRLNLNCSQKFDLERQHLQPLPPYRSADYEILSVRVTSHSTITVRCILYTVPSRLIGTKLTVHLYHDRLVGFIGTQQVVELHRLYVSADSPLRRARSINYRHVIDSLRRKPGALLHSTWQQDLLPNDNYRQLWQKLLVQFAPRNAARLMTESLYIAAKFDCETAVATFLEAQLLSGSLTLHSLQKHFLLADSDAVPTQVLSQHSLSKYDQLINHDFFTHHRDDDTSTAAQGIETFPSSPHLAAI